MRPEEAREAVKLARKSFGVLEGIFVPAPKSALVAVLGGKIVGGFFYKVESFGGRKVGIADFLFIDPSIQGLGVGKQLYEQGIRLLREQDCDALMGIVRDDNVASWGRIVQDGFVRGSLPKMVRLLGLSGVAKLFFTLYGLAIGHEYYIALPDQEAARQYEKQERSFGQILSYVLINLALAAPLSLVVGDAASFFAALLLVFLGSILTGYVGTLFSRRQWRFRLVSGGALVCLALSILNTPFRAFVPVVGNWYPTRYENTRAFQRDMAINAISVWVFLLLLSASAAVLGDAGRVVAYLSGIASVLLLFRCVPLAPIGSYGGARVFAYNRVIFGLLVIASVFSVGVSLLF